RATARRPRRSAGPVAPAWPGPPRGRAPSRRRWALAAGRFWGRGGGGGGGGRWRLRGGPHDARRGFPRTAAGGRAFPGLRARPVVLWPAVRRAGGGRRRAATGTADAGAGNAGG